MPQYAGLEKGNESDWQGLVDNILRKGTPRRCHHIELFHDAEVRDAIAERFGLMAGVRRDEDDYERWKLIRVCRFCGFDHVRVGVVGMDFHLHRETTADTAELARAGGRSYQDEHSGPIMSWEDFERFPWPDPHAPDAMRELEWFQENLPEDMCIIGSGGFAHFAEFLCWLMGYETLCFALYDNRDLVAAIAGRLTEHFRVILKRMLQFDRVRIIWGSDDMGHKTALLISRDDTREFFLPGHRLMARMSHAAGRPYLLHSCGNLNEIIDDLIDDVQIDAKHSFEDTIEDVRQVKGTYGRRIALLGGIDVDFLCRADEQAIRRRVRETLDVCLPGGGYCLGSGNSVANYVPLDHYLAMVDEGMLYSA
jgi:uroporphyrinogen decarboxylase